MVSSPLLQFSQELIGVEVKDLLAGLFSLSEGGLVPSFALLFVSLHHLQTELRWVEKTLVLFWLGGLLLALVHHWGRLDGYRVPTRRKRVFFFVDPIGVVIL